MKELMAFVNSGRWVVECPKCKSAILIKQFGAPIECEKFGCVECGMGMEGVLWQRVKDFPAHVKFKFLHELERCMRLNYELPSLEDIRAIETVLLRRAHVAWRNWQPGLTLQELIEAEPFLHFSWTAPRTWVVAEVVTASIMNIHVRDNELETSPAKVTMKGDLTPATGANALARLPIGADGKVLVADSTKAAGMKWEVEDSQAIKIKNTSGATAVANDAGYIDAAGEYKTTTTAFFVGAWCVVLIGGANNADIHVCTRGRVTVNVATGVVAGEFLETTTTAGRADGRTGASPSIFAIALTNESANTCTALLLTGRTEVVTTSAIAEVLRIDASGQSTTTGTEPWYGTINDAAPTASPVTVATITGALANITPASSTLIGKIVIRNTTRGNEALIASISGNDITFVSNAPLATWQNGDALNAESANAQNGFRVVDMSQAAEIPVTAIGLYLYLVIKDSGAAAAGKTLSLHPDETYLGSKDKSVVAQVQNQYNSGLHVTALINKRFGCRNLATGAGAVQLILRLNGYIQATP